MKHESGPSRHLWDSERFKTYIMILAVVLAVVIFLGLLIKGGTPSNPITPSTTVKSAGDLEFEADQLAKGGSCEKALPLYGKAMELTDYYAKGAVYGRMFKKYCDCQDSLGRLKDGFCTFRNPVNNITLAGRHQDMTG
jgi:hypothetical protein